MDSATYEVEAHVEETHWWFLGRRRLFKKAIKELELPDDAVILDIGTSTGTNLRMLGEMGFSRYKGLDFYDDAIRWCAEKGLGTVHKGDVCNIPMGDKQFDLVLATDIIEHVDADEKALGEIKRVLKDSGQVILTVPAFPSLWGVQDIVSHHKRRYRRGELQEKLKRSGFVLKQSFYFNYLLFIPIWMMRQIIQIFRIKLKSENELNSPLINKILTVVFAIDVSTAKWIHSPFGVSFFARVEKNDAVVTCAENK